MTGTDSSRLDQLLVELGLAESRAQAQAIIMAGSVLVDGAVKDKPGARVKRAASIEVKQGLKYASRGGLKLEGALDAFQVDPRGRTCLDVGASTGGFTDCLLQRGAARVYAVDAGKSQLAWKLRRDPRVVVMEGVNARYLDPAAIPELISLAVIDVSFISLSLILPPLLPVLDAGACVLPMVKPQFEAGRDQVGKGGVVREQTVMEACVDKIAKLSLSLGFIEKGRLPSPVKGPKGNQEIFLHLFLPAG